MQELPSDSSALALLSVVALLIFGLNFGIDFKGGTTIRTESTQPIDVGVYRQALQPLRGADWQVFRRTILVPLRLAPPRVSSRRRPWL